ncbi:MAG: lytic transglycosylase domain-containing protein [Acidobacteria bacterium]|nr:MAG: lytic transglycosylase domain-containing protein [Acidobacteriota bacterium]REJ99368.1 MAG: lytic transglycosylase domain-containing protein [Acidobacteriota bacterium]REK16462.1 MAG: lytic transglycosylase domain-containing protein [Acidobacteriota bacterium]REK44144.1 MAG: lytic transglycosylase domain-containing protein [Acidobacteriota bacterium]
MRHSIFILALTIVAAVPSAAQSRRVFDNFDTAKGVQVIRPEPEAVEAVPAKTSTESAKRKSSRNPLVRQIVMSSSRSMRGFSTGDATVDSYILTSSKKYSIDPLLIYAQMHQESAFKRRARSHKGASGLMQLMPATARRFGVKNIWDPKQNIEAGVRYMRWLIDKFDGDVVLALAGYNAGEGAVMKYGWRIPPYRETQEYVRRITSRYNSITDSRFVRSAAKVDAEAAKEIDKKEAVPLALYERDIIAVRLPNGTMRLVSQ